MIHLLEKRDGSMRKTKHLVFRENAIPNVRNIPNTAVWVIDLLMSCFMTNLKRRIRRSKTGDYYFALFLVKVGSMSTVTLRGAFNFARNKPEKIGRAQLCLVLHAPEFNLFYHIKNN